MGRLVLLALTLLALTGGTEVAAQDLQRGYRNYQELMAGRKRLEQLTPQEREEVIRVHGVIQARKAGVSSGDSQQCRQAKSEASDKANELADYARRLRNCAEASNFSDDCSTEMRRTRSAHGDYESAVSDVGSYCR